MKGITIKISREALNEVFLNAGIVPNDAKIIKIIHSNENDNAFEIICEWPDGEWVSEGGAFREWRPGYVLEKLPTQEGY